MSEPSDYEVLMRMARGRQGMAAYEHKRFVHFMTEQPPLLDIAIAIQRHSRGLYEQARALVRAAQLVKEADGG